MENTGAKFPDWIFDREHRFFRFPDVKRTVSVIELSPVLDFNQEVTG
jgi:hypothetical protein